MEWCIGRKIKNYYCNGFFGRDYDFEGSIILHAGYDYIVIRKESGAVVSTWFDGYTFEEIRGLVESWINEAE